MGIALVGEVGREAARELGRTLLDAYSNFSVYRRRFHAAGVSERDLLKYDPLSVLRLLPPLAGPDFYDLADESVTAGSDIVDMETSSGTTGPRKRRLITYDDDASETRFLARLFGVCGIGESDRVACLDTGPLTLMVSLTRAFDWLGVEEAYALSASPDLDSTMRSLALLDPTVLVTIPSILDRYLTAMERHFGGTSGPSLSKVVYVGEPLAAGTRSALEAGLGLQVFGYYGASETSALGIECRSHDGIHLFTDRNIIEITVSETGSATGEVLVTTLKQQGLPLLRYALNDVIELKDGPCTCGLEFPRATVVGRMDGTASVLGVKISHKALSEATFQAVGPPGAIDVFLTRDGREKLTLVLPDRLAHQESRIRATLLRQEPELAFLVASRFLEVELRFEDEARLGASRKTQGIIDRRERGDVAIR